MTDTFKPVYPLLGSDLTARTDHSVVASGTRCDARSSDTRASILGTPPGHTGRGLQLSDRILREVNPLLAPARADDRDVARAVEAIGSATKPLIIAGGGVKYSGAIDTLTEFAERRGIPVVETVPASRASHTITQLRRADWRDRFDGGQRGGRRC